VAHRVHAVRHFATFFLHARLAEHIAQAVEDTIIRIIDAACR
jgi:hypothetical protein